jgi:extracellular factor (EF) 3-hydroxypalmitic acid methyl ester biosynthesis protein
MLANCRIEKMDEFFQAGPAPQAVRNRPKALERLVAEHRPRTLCSIGCGPAIDIRETIFSHPSLNHVTLVDNDSKALARASANLKTLKRSGSNDIQLIEKNALRYRPERQFDLIWCSGLFDYLSDKAFVFLASRIREMLPPGGLMAVGNFSEDNPSRAYMEIIGEWFLIHRSAERLLQLAKAAGFSLSGSRVMSDKTGVNLFLVVQN